MNDLNLAINTLKENNLTLVVAKKGKIIFQSQERGIKPMYILARENKSLAKNSTIADKVIGKGAALLCAHIGIEKVHTGLISSSAKEVLRKYNIEYEFENSCEYIKNRDETGYCPIEEISMDIDDPIELLRELELFFKK